MTASSKPRPAISAQDQIAIDGLNAILRKAIGLEAASLGDQVLLASYRSTLAALKLDSLSALIAACQASVTADSKASGALEVLIENVVVPESWFFRVSEQFEDLVRAAQAHFVNHQKMRILSLPCANGEEAYSIVMTLMDAGIVAESIDVVGIDLSAHSIARAKRAVYRNSALRRHIRHAQMLPINADEFQISAIVRQRVRLICANFIDLDAKALGRFDAVFVRNLLIYLSPDARAALMNLVANLACARAPVFAGHAELLPSLSAQFVPLPGAKSSLSFMRVDPLAEEVKPTPATPTARTKRNAQTSDQHRAIDAAIDKPGAAKSITQAVIAQAIADQPAAHAAPLSTDRRSGRSTDFNALQLALNQGNLLVAKPLLDALMSKAPTDPEVHFCAGLVALAEQELARADQAFKQCLYLARDHQDALAQRLLIAKRTGSAEATVLQARLQRLRSKAGGKVND